MSGFLLALASSSAPDAAANLCHRFMNAAADAFCDGYVMATVDQMENRWTATCIGRIRALGLAGGRRQLSALWADDPTFGEMPLAWSVEGGLLKVGKCDPAIDRKR